MSFSQNNVMGIQMRKMPIRNLTGRGIESDNRRVHKITPGTKTIQNNSARRLKNTLYKGSSIFDENIDKMS